MSQGMQVIPRSWKRQRNGFSPRTSRREHSPKPSFSSPSRPRQLLTHRGLRQQILCTKLAVIFYSNRRKMIHFPSYYTIFITPFVRERKSGLEKSITPAGHVRPWT